MEGGRPGAGIGIAESAGPNAVPEESTMKSTKTRIMLGLAGMLVAAVPALAMDADDAKVAQAADDSKVAEAAWTPQDASTAQADTQGIRDLKDSSWGRDRPYRRPYDRRNEFRLWLGGFRPDATGPY